MRQLPLDMLLLETDAPDQPAAAHAGKRNQPAWLVDVCRSVSALREEDATTVAQTTALAVTTTRMDLE